jgi:type 1 fimbria pilin
MYRKMLSVYFCLCLFSGALVSGAAQAAAYKDWGKVIMAGSILDAACAIDTVSRYQTVEMGNLPVSTLEQGGEGNKRAFSIRLINCVLTRDTPTKAPEGQYFLLTFGGPTDDDRFAVEGDAQGIALEIEDSLARRAHPGRPLPDGNISAETMILNYSLRVVSNHRALRAGNYRATIPFKIDYY